MANCTLYDLCVVGAGLWGSAAAYHLSLDLPGSKVCLVGPNEPSPQEYSERTIFGAHYDESRIIVPTKGDILEAELAKRSAGGFDVLEKKTGISFFIKCSNIAFGPAGCQEVTNFKRMSEILGINHVLLTDWQLMQRFPYLKIGEGDECILQLSKCGMVNPRKLVLAQKKAAHLQGCDLFNNIVDQIHEKHEPGGGKILELVMADGQVIESRRVLLCTGGFTHFKSLLPTHLQLDVRLAPTQTLRIELNADDMQRLRNMPTISGSAHHYINYMCPPVTYPDGKTYLKIGHGRRSYVDSQEELVRWYQGDGDPRVTEKLMESIRTYFPGLKPLSTQVDTCILTATQSGMPYVDMVTPEIGIAVGGNGDGAILSYEVGRMAAKMIAKGLWDHDLPAKYFKVYLKNQSSKL